MALALDTLAYARRLREAGFSEEQAEGQAEALAAAMTDTLATKQDFALARQDLHDFEVRVDSRFATLDVRLAEMEKRFEYRLEAGLANLEHRITLRMLAAIGSVAALVKLL